jgi:hypothetical protein
LPTITSSSPSIGVVTDAGLDFGAYGLAALMEPDESLLAAVDKGLERQCLGARALDHHLDVGIHPRQELALGVG